MKILDCTWFSPGAGMATIGVVKTINETDEIKFYIGTGGGVSEEADKKRIAEYGAYVPRAVGNLLFFNK